MTKNYRYPTFLFLLFFATASFTNLQAQKKPAINFKPQYIKDIAPIVCPGLSQDLNVHIPPPREYYEKLKGTAKKGGANIIVNYVGFNTNNGDSAKAAFQRAVDIWEAIIESPIDIYVTANWSALGPNTLGSASPSTFFRSSAAPKILVWYPIALAEKLTKRHLNNPGEPDIEANFNRSGNWHFKVDGSIVPSGKYDLVSVVLHELGHGLGFTGFRSVSNGQGSIRAGGLPAIFDTYIENNSGTLLSNTMSFPDPSAALADALTSPLFLDSPVMKLNNSNQRAELYAPSTFSAGSSTYHLNTTTYQGSLDGLMVHALNPGSSIQNPGPIVRNFFTDIGWVHTYIEPDTLKNTETIAPSFVVKAKVSSDTVLTVSSIKLHHSADSFATKTTLTMMPTGNPNEYTATIPTPTSGKAYAYYVSASDATAREYLSPSEALEFKRYFYFYVGQDNTPPVINHTALGFISFPADTASISATITDLFGIKSVMVEYSINDVAKTPFALSKDANDETLYKGKFQFSGASTIQNGDVLKYRIVAKDNSMAGFTTNNPISNFHVVPVVGTKAPKQDYENNFNTASTDFIGNGFSITTPSGFANPAIHSLHPYPDGDGQPDNEINLIYQLLVPIIVRSTNAWMRFDEIALIEPGAAGSVFGNSNFYDYVIVEGSKDKGKTWKRLLDGYDARANSAWLSTWNSAISGANSNSDAVGTPALFKERYIDIKKSFATNDTVQIRFRLFIDQLSHGWGWAIDNLQIQGNLTPLEELLGANKTISLYPNPVANELNILAEFIPSVQNVEISLKNMLGKQIFSNRFENNQPEFKQKIDLSRHPAGIYFVSLKVGSQILTKKIFIR